MIVKTFPYLLSFFSLVYFFLSNDIPFKSSIDILFTLGPVLYILLPLVIIVNILSYIRWHFTLSIFTPSSIRQSILFTSYATSLGYFLPGQIGIDGIRIYLYKRFYCLNLQHLFFATLIEKVIALASQLSIFAFLFISPSTQYLDFFFTLFTFFSVYFLYLKKRSSSIFSTFVSLIVLLLFSISIAYLLSSLFSFLVSLIDVSTDSPVRLAFVSSNLVSVIPLSPQGLGLSEHFFSSIVSFSDSSSLLSPAAIFLSFRLLNYTANLFLSLLFLFLHHVRKYCQV